VSCLLEVLLLACRNHDTAEKKEQIYSHPPHRKVERLEKSYMTLHNNNGGHPSKRVKKVEVLPAFLRKCCIFFDHLRISSKIIEGFILKHDEDRRPRVRWRQRSFASFSEKKEAEKLCNFFPPAAPKGLRAFVV
jgi:hypothetical protein